MYRLVMIALAFLLAFLPAFVAHSEPLKPSFVYQGQLVQSGAPANGAFDFQFEVFDALTGGASLSSVVVVEDVTVTEGLFDTELVFSNDILTGDALWLEVGVRTGASTGAFIVLSPRQPFRQFALNGKDASLSAALTGLVTKTAMNTSVLGTGTLFTQELAVDDPIQIGDEIFTVSEILNDTQLTLDSEPASSAVDVVAFTDGDLFRVRDGDKKDKLVVDRAGVSIGKQGTPISRAEHGTIGNCFIVNSAGSNGTVQFDMPFTSPPRIFMTPKNCLSVRLIGGPGPNEESFSWLAVDANANPTSCDCIHWMAIGL